MLLQEVMLFLFSISRVSKN